MLVNLVDMRPGQTGIIRGIESGFGAAKRIRNMGIRTGKKIKKVAGHSRKGPQTVLVDRFKIAIGFGMAAKILIEVE